jgi:cyclohexadienyl dehydratase
VPDLDGVIRPQLLDLGDDIVRLLGGRAAPIEDSRRADFLAAVQVEGLSDATARALFASLAEVGHFDDRLQQILETGELRVGTTGDYPPFSLLTDSGYQGIDIDMANDLAASLGVKLTLVATSWPALSRDLTDGRFDVAMSGVSRSTERQKIGFLSTPYYHGGKSPIARCKDAARFTSLEAIDNPGVRVIVNPGGTNQAFVTNNIHKAQVIVYDDNTGIFDRIIAGEADVMITDAIEVRLQAARHEGLCATMPDKFLSYLDKAYLMPGDIRLKEYVDTWLELRIADGTVKRIFSRHLP